MKFKDLHGDYVCSFAEDGVAISLRIRNGLKALGYALQFASKGNAGETPAPTGEKLCENRELQPAKTVLDLWSEGRHAAVLPPRRSGTGSGAAPFVI